MWRWPASHPSAISADWSCVAETEALGGPDEEEHYYNTPTHINFPISFKAYEPQNQDGIQDYQTGRADVGQAPRNIFNATPLWPPHGQGSF